MMADALIGVTSVLCFCLPILTILYFRLYGHASLIALVLYYVLTIFRCLGSSNMPPAPDLTNTWDILYSYLETPLLLLSLLFFCPAKQKQQKIHWVMALFVASEVVIVCTFGLTPMASLYVTVPGLSIIVLYSLFLFLRQLKFTLTHGKNMGRVLMLGAILFSYSCYLYLFLAYFMLNKQNVSKIYSLHFLSAGIAALLMTIGLYLMRQRIKGLQELKVTRRELQIIFGN